MYQRSIVTFIDILGFKDVVTTQSAEHIDKILDILNSTSPSNSDDDVDQTEPTVLSFSDSIIRVRNLESDNNIAFPVGHLFYEVNSLVHMQMELVNQGILIRGGISMGNVCVAKNRIFGPAFINAYELESKFANFPRIIVSPELVNSVGTDHLLINEDHTPEEERAYLRKNLAMGDDGLCYVDYLRATRLELDDPDYYPEFLQRHKDTVLLQGKNHSTLSNVSSKYIWLANYHNKVISELSEEFFTYYSITRTDLLISQKDMSALSNL